LNKRDAPQQIQFQKLQSNRYNKNKSVQITTINQTQTQVAGSTNNPAPDQQQNVAEGVNPAQAVD